MFSLVIVFIAELLSTLFNPVLLFLPVPYVVIMHVTNDPQIATRWTLFSWMFIFSIVVFIYYQVKKGRFSNFEVSKRSERPLLFLFAGIVSAIYFSCLFIFQGPVAMAVITFGILFGLIALDLINTRVKASLHVAAVSSILFAFVILNGILYSWILLFIPLVAWSRVKLKRHTVLETVIGGIFGICLTLVIYGIIEYVFRT